MEQRITRRDAPLVAGFLLPGIIILGVLIGVPVVIVLQYSMMSATSFVSPGEFVGFENYLELLQDERFWGGLGRTIVYAGGSVILQVVIGIIFALLLNESFKGNQFVRGAAVVPYILPTVVVAIAFQWILDADSGIVNELIAGLGLEKVNFFSLDLAMWTSIMLSVWAWTPFVTLVFLAGLQTVPHELHESAQVDGAGVVRRFFVITVPMLQGLIVTIVLLRGIWMFNKFDMIALLTGGGPLGRTETLPVYIYEAAFKMFDVGRGAAIAVVTFIIMMVAMSIYLRVFDREGNELTKARKLRRRAQKEA